MVPEIFAFLGTDTARPDFEITTFIFLELIFSWDFHFGEFNFKNEAWWDVYFLMLIFRKFCTFVDTISHFVRFWIPFLKLKSMVLSKSPLAK